VIEAWSEDRERQVIAQVRRTRKSEFLASTRCPDDGRLLGGILRLPDGLWEWQQGGRTSPAASWDEFWAFYVDNEVEDHTTCSSDRRGEIFQEASEFADKKLAEWGGRLDWLPKLRMLAVDEATGDIWCRERESDPHRGAPFYETVACPSRHTYLLQLFALRRVAISAAYGIGWAAGTHVPVAVRPDLSAFGRPQRYNGCVYDFRDGQLCITLP
jgi:hypothetical protein